MQVGAFPIGIDTEAFAQEARAAEKNSTVNRMLASLEGRALVIGVDRLDYSKGLKQRMEAFATFLELSQQAVRSRVTMLQVTPKSRSEVPEYARMQRELEEEAGRINGKHGDVDWTPLRYINKSLSHSTLAGLYRMSRIGLVTPLRDGMNLVAKEYVAAQSPDNPGVLVLSQFAGAVQELKTAARLRHPRAEEAEKGEKGRKAKASRRDPRDYFPHIPPSDWVLVFDCEPRTTPDQRLRFGAYQLRYKGQLIERGSFYEPEVLSAAEQAILHHVIEEEIAASDGERIRVLTRSEFVDQFFYDSGYAVGAQIVGFNLPFDFHD